MPNFIYSRDVPDAPNNPSNDQPDMKQNTNATDDIINVDHYSFNDSNGGLHKWTKMPALVGFPNPLTVGIGSLYTKAATSTGLSTETNLFYIPDTGDPVNPNPDPTRVYQLTRTITASYSLFATNTNYQVGPPSLNGGWTFLPGGMLYQYGYLNNPSNGNVITFPVPFTAPNFPFSIQLTAVVDDNTTVRTGVLSGSESTTGFTLNITNSSHFTRIYWSAIGK